MTSNVSLLIKCRNSFVYLRSEIILITLLCMENRKKLQVKLEILIAMDPNLWGKRRRQSYKSTLLTGTHS